MKKKLARLFQPSFAIYFALMGLYAVVALWMGYYTLAVVELLLTAAFVGYYQYAKNRRHREIQTYIHKHLETIPRDVVAEPPFPMVVARLGDSTIVYANDTFAHLSSYKNSMIEQRISDALPGFDLDWLAGGKQEYPHDVTMGNRRYRAYGTVIRAEDAEKTVLAAVYFTDLTELYQVRDEYIRSRPVVSIIMVDNYEELTKNMTDVAISTLNARINETITQWTDGYHGLLRQLEKNRFLFVFEKRDLKQMMEEKFSVLEEVHKITNPSGLEASLSFGLGVDAANYEEGYDFAALSIEMSLSRGGDQAVVKDRFNFTFYGGRNKEADHRSKVRSRVTANSLMELIGNSSQVFIMGHKMADLDAVGAAMGVACMCRKKGVKAHIVIDLERNASEKLIEEIQAVPEYQNVFISGQEAMLQCDARSTLVVVDTNRPDQVEHKHLLEAVHRVCVIDHHRRAADYISPVVVNLHEPYASSTAELVTELLQYAVEKADVLPIEAKSLLSGIVLDTKSFHVRTGERTFEAAAFLRQLGAETVEVKKLLQNDFRDTIQKYDIIRSARLYKQEIAISALKTPTTRPLAAQAADELLNISGIAASFVLYPDGSNLYISARSMGEINVQVILEPLGGGGNAATAGAQIHGVTVKEGLDALVASIDKYYEK